MSSYLISIKHYDGSEANIVVEPGSDNRWNVEMPVSPSWRWAKIGKYSELNYGVFAFKDTNTPPKTVFRLSQFSDPPSFGQTGPAAFDEKIVSGANATWMVLANEAQLGEVKQELQELEKEINDIYRQAVFDAIGVVDPTPLSDICGAAVALRHAQVIEAGLSLVSCFPYLGDLIGKSAKGGRLLARLNKAKEKYKRVTEVLKNLQKRMDEAKVATKRKIDKHILQDLNRRSNAIRRTVTKKVEEVAAKAGLKIEHLNNWRVFCSQCEPPKLAILRNRNKAALKWEKIGKPHYVPKPMEVKLKTAKGGPNDGLVVYPQMPMKAWEQDNINYLKMKGFRFEPDGPGGVLISPKNEKFFADVDKMGIYDIETLNNGRPHGQAWKGKKHNDSVEMRNEINRKVYDDIENDQHGGQDFFYGRGIDGKPLTEYDDVAQVWKMGRHPDPDETFTIVHPNGDVETVTVEGLDKIYSNYGITNPYKVK